jgi:hypothetical protein
MCLQHTHPPIPISNVGRVKGVSRLIQNFTYSNKSKPASHKCRTVKYVLTRSSKFQQNRKGTQLRGTEIPRKKYKNSTPQKILSSKLAQKRLPTSRKCQVMPINSDNIKTSKSSSGTDLYKINILTEFERVAAATSLRTEENPPPDASTAAATSSSGMDSAETGEPLLAAMACRTCSKNEDALSSRTIVFVTLN